VAVCNRRYVVNVAWPGGELGGLNPEAACPAFFRPRPDPFRPRAGEEIAEQQRIVVPGPKMRDFANVDQGGPRYGLTGNGLATSSIGSDRNGAPANMSFAPAR
jgi:hypothetical protein